MLKYSFRALCAAGLMLMAGALAAQDSTSKEFAIVDLSANMIREVPDYAGELGDQALMGTVV